MAVLRAVKRFDAAWLADLTGRVEAERGAPFEKHGASLRVRPLRVAHVGSVGEGLSLDLDPHELGTWEWWGEFESTLEVRRRPRLGGPWIELCPVEDVRAWVDRELDRYLAKLT